MNKKVLFTILLAVFIISIFGVMFAYNFLSDYASDTIINQQSAKTNQQNTEKQKAPDFSVYDEDGNKTSLSNYLGKPIIINFWASWCPPCKAELPDFEEMYKEHKDEIVFLMICSVDGQRETVSTASSYIASEGYSFPVFYDTTQEATYSYGVTSLPTTVFIDEDGFIQSGYVGKINRNTLQKNIKQMFEKTE